MVSGNTFSLYITVVIAITFIIAAYRLLTKKNLKTNILNIVIVIIYAVLAIINNYYNIPFFKHILAYLLICLVLSLVFKEKLRSTILNFFIIWLLLMFFDTFIPVILSFLGVIHSNIPAFNLNLIVIMMTLFEGASIFQLMKIKRINTWFKKTLENIYKNTNDIFFIIIIFLIVVLLNAYNIINLFLSASHIIVAAIGVLITIIIAYIIILKEKESNLIIKNRYLSASNDFYNKIANEYQILKHNVNNQLMVIYSKGNIEVKKLIDEQLKIMNNKAEFLPIFQNVPDGLKDFLYLKFADLNIKTENITIINNCEIGIMSKFSTRIYNALLETLGIIIDNSLDAAKECEEKMIYLDISSANNVIVFKIINTFANEIDIESFGKLNYSTKKKNRGVGIYSLLKNEDINYSFKIINNKFQTTIAAKLKN